MNSSKAKNESLLAEAAKLNPALRATETETDPGVRRRLEAQVAEEKAAAAEKATTAPAAKSGAKKKS